MSVSRIHVFKTQQPSNWLVISIHMRNHIPQSSQIYQKKTTEPHRLRLRSSFIIFFCAQKNSWTNSEPSPDQPQRCFKKTKKTPNETTSKPSKNTQNNTNYQPFGPISCHLRHPNQLVNETPSHSNRFQQFPLLSQRSVWDHPGRIWKHVRSFSKIGFFFDVEVVEIWIEFWDSIYITYYFVPSISWVRMNFPPKTLHGQSLGITIHLRCLIHPKIGN